MHRQLFVSSVFFKRTMVIDGTKIAKVILTRLARCPAPRGEFAAVLVGRDPSSLSFLRKKAEVAAKLGVKFRIHRFPARIKEAVLIGAVRRLSGDRSVSGVIIQLPLPRGIDRNRVLDAVLPDKDADCLSSVSLGRVARGTSVILPPAAGTVKEILFRQGAGRSPHAAIIGAGPLVGMPVAAWLLGAQACADLAVFRSGTRDLRRRLRDYDLVVSGAGAPALFALRDVRKGAIVIDFGYGRRDGRSSGDLAVPRSSAEARRAAYTPTPGGTGPILVAKLFENFYALGTSH